MFGRFNAVRRLLDIIFRCEMADPHCLHKPVRLLKIPPGLRFKGRIALASCGIFVLLKIQQHEAMHEVTSNLIKAGSTCFYVSYPPL
jgi:hypothetical protein